MIDETLQLVGIARYLGHRDHDIIDMDIISRLIPILAPFSRVS